MRLRPLFERPLTPSLTLVGTLSYDLGGMNGLTGETRARGYYLSVYLEIRAKGYRPLRAFPATILLIKAARRFNATTLAQLTPTAKHVDRLVAHVLANLPPPDAAAAKSGHRKGKPHVHA